MTKLPKTTSWQQISNSNLLRFLLLFACGWALVVFIGYFYTVIAIFTAAGIFAALLNYPVQWISRYIPRGLAIAIVCFAAIALLITLFTALGLEILNQGQGLVDRITEAAKQQNFDFLPIRDWLNKVNFERLIDTLRNSLASGLGIAQNLFSSVFMFIFLAVITVYMLIDGKKIWETCLKIIPEKSRGQFADVFQRSFLGFLRGQISLMLFLSSMSLVVFSVLGVRYSLLLGIIVGLLDAIPGIGATLGVFVVTTLVLVSQGWQLALTVVIASILLQQVQDNFIHPKVMGNALQLNPVFVFLALFIGERVAGLLGVFLSIPIAGMIAAWQHAEESSKTTNLTPIADQDPAAPANSDIPNES